MFPSENLEPIKIKIMAPPKEPTMFLRSQPVMFSWVIGPDQVIRCNACGMKQEIPLNTWVSVRCDCQPESLVRVDYGNLTSSPKLIEFPTGKIRFV